MSVLKQIADLQNLSHRELVSLWHTLCGNEPPASNRRFIIKRLAYRIQEIAYGGLSEEAYAKMDAVLKRHGYDELGMPKVSFGRSQSRKDMPVIGSKLVREWNGKRYEVTTLRDCFEYEGRRYRSLSAIAKAIEGPRVTSQPRMRDCKDERSPISVLQQPHEQHPNGMRNLFSVLVCLP